MMTCVPFNCSKTIRSTITEAIHGEWEYVVACRQRVDVRCLPQVTSTNLSGFAARRNSKSVGSRY